MTKKETHRQELIPLVQGYAESGQTDRLFDYLCAHSELPSPRSNLELAFAFGDVIGGLGSSVEASLWSLCAQMTALAPSDAPVNSPKEFIPCCGAIGLGALGCTFPARLDEALMALRSLASDPRWRLREGVCFGLQRLLGCADEATLRTLAEWVAGGKPLQMRAVAAAVADPPLLKNRNLASAALELHRAILKWVQSTAERTSPEFKTLRQGLGYSLSVVVAALPGEGFRFMAELVGTRDPALTWIMKQNLAKNRLLKYYPQEVDRLLSTLSPAEAQP